MYLTNDDYLAKASFLQDMLLGMVVVAVVVVFFLYVIIFVPDFPPSTSLTSI
jgi:hypothetical protein